MQALQLIAAIGLLVGNFFFVAVEFAITNARPTMVDDLVERGVPGARSFKHGVDHIDAYLSACQLGITVCSIGLGITAEPVVASGFEALFGEGAVVGISAATVSFVLAYALVSMFHVVLGELTPKSLAIARTRAIGLALVPPMRVFYLATKPVVDLFNWLGNAVLKPFGIPPASEAGSEPHSEAELQSIIAQSLRSGELKPEEQAFASGAFTFGDRRAREVMVPRAHVHALDAGCDRRAAARLAAEFGHHRLPVCEQGDLDRVLGAVHLIDLAASLAAADHDAELGDLVRPLRETSEAVLLDDLLEELRAHREQMALVRDEYGTATGIITLEDIIEQILGDIRDEFDPPRRRLVEQTSEGFRVAGDTRLREIADELGFDPGAHHEATVGGYVIERLGHVPVSGEELAVGGACIRADEVDGANVRQVLIRTDTENDMP
jgi:CBS domain containing-hemolysin-like protein